MVKRVSALSQVLKETQAAANQPHNTALPQSDNTEKQENANTALAQNVNTALPESGNTAIQKYGNTVKLQNRKTTNERVKLTFYLDPEDTQRFDALRYEYNVKHAQRLDQNKFMRLIVKHLDLSILEGKS